MYPRDAVSSSIARESMFNLIHQESVIKVDRIVRASASRTTRAAQPLLRTRAIQSDKLDVRVAGYSPRSKGLFHC
jgi:hypothetical protein